MRVDPATRRIVALDVERAEADLAAYRPIATRWWKQDEGPFAGVRSRIAAPGATVRGIRCLASAWRTEASRFSTEARNPDAPPLQSHTDAEVDQIGRTADTIARPPTPPSSPRCVPAPSRLGR